MIQSQQRHVSQSNENQAKGYLNFAALESAKVVNEILDLDCKELKKMSHDETIKKVNELAIRKMFLPLSLVPIVLTKFGSRRLGAIDHAHRFFDLSFKKYNCENNMTSPDVHKLFSELMWAYIGKDGSEGKYTLKLEGLAQQCPCAETYTALKSHYNKIGHYSKTIELHTNSSAMQKDAPSYRYYARARKETEDTKLQEIYREIRKENPALMNDIYFFVDYIKLGLRSDVENSLEQKLADVEILFVEFPNHMKDEKGLRELLSACFDAKCYEKAESYFLPYLDEEWVGKKTRELIIRRTAENSLEEALCLYDKLLPRRTKADIEHARFEINFHADTNSSYGTQKYGPEPLVLIELRLWHLYKTLLTLEKSQDNKWQLVNLSLITGKGKDHKLKKQVMGFIKERFGWICTEPNNASWSNSGVIQLECSLETLLKKRAQLPKCIDPTKALQYQTKSM